MCVIVCEERKPVEEKRKEITDILDWRSYQSVERQIKTEGKFNLLFNAAAYKGN